MVVYALATSDGLYPELFEMVLSTAQTKRRGFEFSQMTCQPLSMT